MRVSLFFDGKNFHSGWRDRACGKQIDFPKLAQWLAGKIETGNLWGAYYYTGIETGDEAKTEKQQKLLSFLNDLERKPGYFVRRFERKARHIRCRKCRELYRFTQEKEVDTTMVADMLRLAAVNAFDVMVLLSGDRDLAPAVEGVQSLGKKVYVATWGGAGLSRKLRNAAFDHIDLLEGISRFESNPIPMADPSQQASTSTVFSAAPPERENDETDMRFLDEIITAQGKFKEGYLGLNFFLRKWKSPNLDESPDARGRILDRMLKRSKIEIYTAPDGNQAIRPIRNP